MKKLALLALYGVNRLNIELFGRANLIRVSTLFAPLQLLLPPRWGPHTSKRVQTHTLRFDLDDSIRPLISGSQCGCMQSGLWTLSSPASASKYVAVAVHFPVGFVMLVYVVRAGSTATAVIANCSTTVPR